MSSLGVGGGSGTVLGEQGVDGEERVEGKTPTPTS
jgi:hypothetical protein